MKEKNKTQKEINMLELNHKNLEAWKMSLKLTKEFPAFELYGLTSQLRRAVVSIPSNIVEGSARSSVRGRRYFFEIARSSLVEIDTQIELPLELDYCKSKEFTGLSERMNSTFALLSRLITRTR